jgi:hypothetical protein
MKIRTSLAVRSLYILFNPLGIEEQWSGPKTQWSGQALLRKRANAAYESYAAQARVPVQSANEDKQF